jgi:hypothetical protein
MPGTQASITIKEGKIDGVEEVCIKEGKIVSKAEPLHHS